MFWGGKLQHGMILSLPILEPSNADDWTAEAELLTLMLLNGYRHITLLSHMQYGHS